MGGALVGLGALLVIIGVIWIAVIAFQSGDIVWGVLSLLCGLVAIIYAAQHMDKARTPLLMLAGGIVLEIIGSFLGGMGAVNVNTP
jgi:hypothetical protein